MPHDSSSSRRQNGGQSSRRARESRERAEGYQPDNVNMYLAEMGKGGRREEYYQERAQALLDDLSALLETSNPSKIAKPKTKSR